MANALQTMDDGSDGSKSKLKKFVASPMFLAVTGLVVGIVVFQMWRGKSAQGNAASSSMVANPAYGSAQGPQVLSTMDLTGLQDQLSNLLGQVSTAAAGAKPAIPGTTQAPTPSWTTRQSGGGGNWDQWYGGIPLYGGTNLASLQGFLPFGSAVDVVGQQQGEQGSLSWWTGQGPTTKQWDQLKLPSGGTAWTYALNVQPRAGVSG